MKKKNDGFFLFIKIQSILFHCVFSSFFQWFHDLNEMFKKCEKKRIKRKKNMHIKNLKNI